MTNLNSRDHFKKKHTWKEAYAGSIKMFLRSRFLVDKDGARILEGFNTAEQYSDAQGVTVQFTQKTLREILSAQDSFTCPDIENAHTMDLEQCLQTWVANIRTQEERLNLPFRMKAPERAFHNAMQFGFSKDHILRMPISFIMDLEIAHYDALSRGENNLALDMQNFYNEFDDALQEKAEADKQAFYIEMRQYVKPWVHWYVTKKIITQSVQYRQNESLVKLYYEGLQLEQKDYPKFVKLYPRYLQELCQKEPQFSWLLNALSDQQPSQRGLSLGLISVSVVGVGVSFIFFPAVLGLAAIAGILPGVIGIGVLFSPLLKNASEATTTATLPDESDLEETDESDLDSPSTQSATRILQSLGDSKTGFVLDDDKLELDLPRQGSNTGRPYTASVQPDETETETETENRSNLFRF